MPKILWEKAVKSLLYKSFRQIFSLSFLKKKDKRRKSRTCKKIYYSAY